MPAAARPRLPLRRLSDIAMLVAWAAVFGRALTIADSGWWPWYIAGFAAFLAIQWFVSSGRAPSSPLLHLLLAVQAAIVLVLLTIDPELDFVTALFVLQCYEAAVVFPARPRAVWVTVLVVLIGGSLVSQLGVVRGLALGLIPMAIGVVLAMFVVATGELDDARAASERMVTDLRSAQERLRAHAEQADELAAIEQRTRVAVDLERSVAQTLASAREASAAARHLTGEPERAVPELERLQELTQEALAQMRRVITELRPSQEG